MENGAGDGGDGRRVRLRPAGRPGAGDRAAAGPGRRPARQRLQLQTFAQPDGNHLLLRFDGYVHNAGQGAFEMRGSNRVDDEYTTVVQRVFRSDGSFFDDSTGTRA